MALKCSRRMFLSKINHEKEWSVLKRKKMINEFLIINLCFGNSFRKVAFKDLERTCDDYERSMEELGVHLYESKLKVDDLKEATGVIKNAQWKDDSEVTQCHGCEKDFSLSRRKVGVFSLSELWTRRWRYF